MEADAGTKQVLGWKGLHVFHYPMSSTSQKLRILLNLKGLAWTSQPIDLVNNEHLTPYYLGINPRGLVPAIVDDGVVHIESNDIILHLDKDRAGPRLVPRSLVEAGRTLASVCFPEVGTPAIRGWDSSRT